MRLVVGAAIALICGLSSAASGQAIEDCPPPGTPARERYKKAGVECADEIRAKEAAEREQAAFVQRGVAFRDRPLPASMQARIRREMDGYLLDGISARYQFPPWRHPEVYCFSVNAKNSFGAYTGWSTYAVQIGPGSSIAIVSDDYGDCDALR